MKAIISSIERSGRRLEEPRATLELVAPPLRQAVEVLACDLQDGLELRVRQVALQQRRASAGPRPPREPRPGAHLQVQAVHVGRQAVVGDEQQVVGVQLGGLV